MTLLTQRDVAYRHGATEMTGRLIAPANAPALPAVVLLHDAYGFSTPQLLTTAERIAARGIAVFVADLWAGRAAPAHPDDIGRFIGGMVSDRAEWQGRVAAAHAAAAAQPEINPQALVSLGYCFGGSSALEYLRTGGDVLGVIAIHAGLDLLEFDWTAAPAGRTVLVCTGADDPMATAEQRASLEAGMNHSGTNWEVQLYSGTVHAFTSEHSKNSPVPHLFNYHERSATRAWAATLGMLDELFSSPPHAPNK